MTTLRSLLREGPGPRLAFLPSPNSNSIAETLVAFANGEGGTVVLGVDPGGALGDQLVDEEAEGALRAALALCRPPMRTEWQQEELQTGSIIMLRVERSSELHILSDGRALVRHRSENRPLGPAELEMLVANRSMGDFESEEVSGAARDDLDENVIDEYLEKRQQRNPHGTLLPKTKLLQQIGAIAENGTPTISGMLLFGKEPQLFLPHSRAVFVKFVDKTARFHGGRKGGCRGQRRPAWGDYAAKRGGGLLRLWPPRGDNRPTGPHRRAQLAGHLGGDGQAGGSKGFATARPYRISTLRGAGGAGQRRLPPGLPPAWE